MPSRQPLKDSPLQEALFEIRFPPVNDYSLFAGGMAITHEENFPIVEKLPTADLPDSIYVEGIVKHRFFTEDRDKLFQTGPDVISVNYTKYLGFESFVYHVKKILESSEKFGVDIKKPIRLGLRYINRFKEINDITQVLNFKRPFENIDFTQKTLLVQGRIINQEIDEFLSTTIFQFPIDTADLILDLEAFSESPKQDESLDYLVKWIEVAHDIVWENFLLLVTSEELERRK